MDRHRQIVKKLIELETKEETKEVLQSMLLEANEGIRFQPFSPFYQKLKSDLENKLKEKKSS